MKKTLLAIVVAACNGFGAEPRIVSPYESAALLSLDGSGEWATTFKGVGRGNTFECLDQDYYPFSLGYLYEAATEFCGFKTN